MVASGTSKRPLPPAGLPRLNGDEVANDIVVPVTKSNVYRLSGTAGLNVPSVEVNARVALLADGSASTHAKVTGGVGNTVPAMIRLTFAGVVDMSITAMPDSSAISTDPNEPPQATSTVFVAAR